MSYQKILVALDRSDLSQEVFQQALAIAKQDQAALMLFHCVPIESQILTPYPSFYSEEMLTFSQQLNEQLYQEVIETEKWLQSYGDTATEQGIATECSSKIGEPGRLIRDLAKSWPADLIVLGRRGLKGISEIFLGSVSNYVVHQAHCSVLVVQHQDSKAAN
jgi:nucleotide-binding universal stress UspA family protein